MKQGPTGSVVVVARAYAHGSEDVVSAPLSLTGDQPAPQMLKLSHCMLKICKGSSKTGPNNQEPSISTHPLPQTLSAQLPPGRQRSGGPYKRRLFMQDRCA